MRRTGFVAVLVLVGLVSRAHAQSAGGTATPNATPTITVVAPSEPLTGTESGATQSPQWRDTGLLGSYARWQAGLSVLGAVSSRYAGDGRPGWLFEVAPSLRVERPPARFSGWLAYEPALRARAAIAPRDRSRFELEAAGRNGSISRSRDTEAAIHHQGSLGFAVGKGLGPRFSAQGHHRITLDQLHSEQEGLVEHVETEGAAAAEWVAPDRGTIGLHAGALRVRYPFEGMRTADLDRLEGSAETTARFHLRMTGALRFAASQTEYRLAKNDDGSPREVQTFLASAHVEAQPMPALSLRLGGGPGIRRDPETTFDFPLTAGVTADIRRRYRVSLDAGTALEDSLWRSNKHLRVVHSRGHATADVRPELNVGVFAGLALADYPEAEIGTAGELENRNDLTWGAGAELSTHVAGRLRATVSVSHTERRSTFPGYEWEENRCVLSAFMGW